MSIPNDKLSGLLVAAVVLVFMVFIEIRSNRRAKLAQRQAMQEFVNQANAFPARNGVYDKAKYHADSVAELNLPEEHAYYPTTFFLSWLIANCLMSDRFNRDDIGALDEYRHGRITINQLYERWGCCLTSDMLSQEGNSFARFYFSSGKYIDDYMVNLQGSLKSEYLISYTRENESTIFGVIGGRYHEWKSTEVP